MIVLRDCSLQCQNNLISLKILNNSIGMPEHTASSLPSTNNYIEQLPCIATVTENTN
jgi:hypothetical protein